MSFRQIETFLHPSRNGQLLNIVKEHYLRDDIESGSFADPDCSEANRKLHANADHYLIVDTNVVLHQTDFLEHESITDVVILSTVYQEVRHKNISIFLRLKNMLRNNQKRFFYFSNEFHKDTYIDAKINETANDRNDRAIRVASLWYKNRIPGKEIILLTGDNDNLRQALAMGVKAMSMKDYVECKVHDTVVADLISWGAREESQGRQKRKRIYKEYLSSSEIQAGIKEGKYFQGTFTVSKHNYEEAWVERDDSKCKNAADNNSTRLYKASTRPLYGTEFADKFLVSRFLHDTSSKFG